ncbi:sensor histidine kinase [Kordia jejudonensis]|uniref:sensor histidine kinase n=1 Tax=Kordia jejudonensis TaxID=1348245 RepID=UPI000629B342|nr:HAMP domain-containing sensor histidine kinase [Kordia jejudonensis]
MKSQRFSWILYFIIATIVTTVAVQVYWNYKNYQTNKKQFINQVQISLDNAVEAYYADIAKQDKLMFVSMDASNLGNLPKIQNVNVDSILRHLDHQNFNHSDTIIIDTRVKEGKKFPQKTIDSLLVSAESTVRAKFSRFNDNLQKYKDSVQLFREVSSLYISISEDSLNFKKLQSFLDIEFKRKQIALPYQLKRYYAKELVAELNVDSLPSSFLKTYAKSTYSRPFEKLELRYANISKAVLKESSMGILLSTLLTLAIISSLLYLLNVINKQKQLAEIKNDLISNITHEFKTPITTISTALEAIQHFGAMKNPEKAQKYLSISEKQLKKLHLMVEKLLETATLDSEKLLLKKEPLDVVDFVEKITEKQQTLTTGKSIIFSSNTEYVQIDLDSFHFENAITNLIDNALKYGGDTIEVTISKVLETVEIKVIDDGNTIEKSQREKIFDKFYRIPKGNTHDVKGFGIGLYYTKKIIEKHNGTIQLVPDAKHTIFKITLPK